MQTEDGRVRVSLPAGASPEALDVTVKPLSRYTWGGPNKRLVNMFEVTATAPERAGAAVTQFNQDVDLTYTLPAGYAGGDLAGLDPYTLEAVTFNPANARWDPLPTTVTWNEWTDGQGQLRRSPIVTAKTRHFSVFGNQASPMVSGPGMVLGFQNDPYSGASVAGYPIEIPPGPAGFAPSIALSYNSGSVDEMRNKRDTGSWVGIGWSLTMGSVTKNLETNKYYLSFNGMSYELVSDAQVGTGAYRTIPESGLVVTNTMASWNTPWTVRDRNGVLYEFGSLADGLQFQKDTCGDGGVYRWDLSKIKDLHNNEIRVAYTQDIVQVCSGTVKHDVVSAYPSAVYYGGNTGVAGSKHRVKVQFNASGDSYTSSTTNGWVRNDNPGSPYPRIRENKRLNSIEVWVDSGTGTGTGLDYNTYDTLVRKYTFTYTTTAAGGSDPWPAGTMVLDSITQVGADGFSTLPATAFTYATPTTYFWTGGTPTSSPCNPCDPAQFTWPHLATVSNGYGATLTYGYTSIPDPGTSPTNSWVRAAATSRTTNPGIGPNLSATYAYTGNPAYYVPDANNHWLDEFRGWNQVKETDAAGHYTKHYYYTTGTINGEDADKLKGKEYETEHYSSSDVLLKEEVYDWEWAWCCVYQVVCSEEWRFTNNHKTWYVYLEETNSNAGAKTSRVRHTYSLPADGTCQETLTAGTGLKVRDNLDGDTATTADDATVFWQWLGGSNNQKDLPTSQKTHEGDKTADSGPGLKAETTFYYDASYGSPQADLTRVRRSITIGGAYAETAYAYDSYGNKVKETDALGNLRTWQYDPWHRPLLERYPVVGGVIMQESGVWDLGTANLLSWMDVNGQATTYTYDTFKRLTGVSRPGESSAGPSVQYVYANWGVSQAQHLETTTRISDTETTWSRLYFDGLGRTVQTQTRGETIGAVNYTVLDTTAYNNRGLTDQAYVTQRLDGSTFFNYKAPEAGWLYTSYAYDGIGHGTTQTNPDTTTVSNVYVDWKTTTTNERGFKKAYTNDGYGRLAKVEEFDASHVLYATTTYGYDVLGNLTLVTDQAGNQTSMTYDAAGRKTAMSDPDMGSWSYAYDANGNLTSQTDAKTQVLVFQYDPLNRVTKKCSTSCTTGSLLAAYTYDGIGGGNWGRGLRTGMVDQTGAASLVYDRRGQTIKETKAIWGAANPLTGLVAQWNGDEGTGPAALDASGNRNHAGLGRGAYFSAGKYGTALTFDGIQSQVLGGGPVIPASAKTVAFWIKRTGAPSGGAYTVLGNASTDAQWGTKLSLDNSTYRVKVELFKGTAGTPNVSFTGATAMSLNTWHHVAVTWDGTTAAGAVKLYVNGSQDATGTAAATEATAGSMGLWMGSLTANQGHLGQLDDVRVYNRALTSTEVGNLAGSADSFTTAYAYDLAGRVKTVTYPNGETVTQTYTGRGLPYQVTSSAEGTLVTSGAEYNALGQLTFYRLASGVAKSVSHWGIEHNSGSTTSYGRIYEIKFQYLSSTVHQQLQHSWDAGGNLTSRVDGVQSETESYTYDFLHRLTGVSNAYTESFSYNAIGNMTNKNGNAYTSGDTAHKHAVTSAAGTSYSYDANGSMTARGSQTLTWDVENRLASVSGGAAFGYDGDAVRVRRTEGGETVAYPNRFYEKNLSTSTVTKYYYLGGELINVRRGSTWESVHSDLLGGTTVSSNGATEKSRTRYYPFGATRSSTGTLETEKKFTGQRLDQSGLYFYNARYYDAGLGRFISADPKVQDWSVPQGLNRYSYVVNRPLVMVDPTGYDYVFVHGMDGRFSSFRTMIDALPPGEKACVFSWSTGTLYEATGDLASSWEEDQSWAKSLGPVPMKAAQLGEAISGLADVKLVGHSLGGNVVAQVLINAAEAGSHGNITAAVLIDAPLNSGLATGLSAAATGGFVQPSIAGDLGAIGTSPVPVINLISTDPWFSALNATLDGALNLTIPSGHSMTGNAQAIIIVAALSASSTGRLADTFWEYEWERLYG